MVKTAMEEEYKKTAWEGVQENFISKESDSDTANQNMIICEYLKSIMN